MKINIYNSGTVVIIVMVCLFISTSIFAQTSFDRISYQAVIRDTDGNLVTNQAIGLKIGIWQGGWPAKYEETHTPTTNANGLISIQIGGGTAVLFTFSNIDWSYDYTWIKTEIDPTGGTNYIITGDRQLLSVPHALYAKKADTALNVITYSVGDFAQGGIVYWVDETEQHGLVCAKTDQSTGTQWFAGTTGYTRAYGDGPFSGEMNTSIIISSHVAIGDDGGNYAARICAQLKITEGGKTYGDWYLPSKEELYLMYLNKDIIDATAIANGGSAFPENEAYWSSTEYDDIEAWRTGFYGGFEYQVYKGNYSNVRAIRAF